MLSSARQGDMTAWRDRRSTGFNPRATQVEPAKAVSGVGFSRLSSRGTGLEARALVIAAVLTAVWAFTAFPEPLGAAEESVETTASEAAAAAAEEVQGAKAAAPGPINRHFEIRPATSEIRIDSVLDEPAWDDALRLPLVSEWAPGDNSEPPVRTECFVTFDDDHLYVAFRAHDPDPKKIRARLADRDVAFTDDTVGFLVDTFNDQREAYEFRVNPLGVQMDGTLSDIGEASQDINFWQRVDYDGRQDWSWDAIWASSSKLTADGYVAELAIPFRQLRFGAGSGPQVWGFLATRHYPRNVEYQFRSSYRDFDRNCQVCQFDTLGGLVDLPRGRSLEVNPTVTFQNTEILTGEGASEDETEGGLWVRWGITPSVTLNGTVNPDFSQVEADSAQLDVNERFALFFPEKRPFFLDGAEIFASPIRAVFTRTISDPTGGIKITGREGKYSFGALFAEDRENSLLFPFSQRSTNTTLDQEVESGVLRIRRDLGKTSNIAFLYTSREADEYHNHVLAVDGRVQVGSAGVLRLQYLSSDTRYPDEVAEANDQPLGSFDGDAFEVRYDYQTRNWLGIGRFRSVGKDFRADHGFIRQADSDNLSAVLIRSFWAKPGAWYSRLAVQYDHGEFHTEEGERFEESNNITFIYEGGKQTIVQWALRDNFETFLGASFNNPRTDVFFSILPNKNTEFDLLLRGGKTIDVVNVRQADFFQILPRFKFKFGRGFTGDFELNYQEFRIDEGTFLRAALPQTRLFYHFNSRMFVRTILQYRDVERVPELHDRPIEPEVETFLTQFLFSYKLNSRTALFAGYSDNYLGTSRLDFDQTDRTLFLKLGYSWLR